jgi:virginiamycin B lyase
MHTTRLALVIALVGSCCGYSTGQWAALSELSPSYNSGSSARHPPRTQPRCNTTVQARVFARLGRPVSGWVENLGFDGHGGLWASEYLQGRVVRLDAQGVVSKSIPVPDPGAIELGPDGLMYVNYRGKLLNAVKGDGKAGVLRFDPAAEVPTTTIFTSGINSTNGAAFDEAGNLYVSDTIGKGAGIIRIRRDGSVDRDWTEAARIKGTNGLAVSGKYLFASITTDKHSPILRIPLDAPAARSKFVELSRSLNWPKSKPKLLDDLTFGPDNRLYVTSVAGELLRIDPSGAACVLYSGPSLTSVRFPYMFPPFSPSSDLFVTSENGKIIHIHLE